MAAMTREEAYAFIDAGPRWAILTTVGPGGYPHAVPLSYYRDGDAGGRASPISGGARRSRCCLRAARR